MSRKSRDINDLTRERGPDAARAHLDEAPDIAREPQKVNGRDDEPPPWEPPGEPLARTTWNDNAEPLPVRSVFPINEKAIPLRRWIVPGLLMRRHVTGIVAPPAVGKSLFTIHLALMCAAQRPWAGWRPRGRFKTLFINAEDDNDEMDRRFLAAAATMGIDQNDLIGQVITLADLDPSERGIVVARSDTKTRTMIKLPLLDRIVATIRAHEIDLIFVDPFTETFEGDENSSELKWAIALWREVARRTNCAVCLVHHTKKYAIGMAGDVDAARGSSVFSGIARVVVTAFTASKEDVERMGIPESQRSRYLRVDDAKGNYHLISDQARWFHKTTFHINNESEDQPDIPGDDVGALVPWNPNGVFDGIEQQAVDKALAAIDLGILDKKGQKIGEFYTLANTQKEDDAVNRWVGLLVTTALACDEARAKLIITQWKKAGTLVTFKYKRPSTRRWVQGCGSKALKQRVEEPGAGPLFQPEDGDDDA